ncbi:GNAT family acetyltransferase [Sandaracinobacteroides saxicola]|uniref:GNAT family acetyltransferase n=1 Tax=Sandaracinobacteroides saxicola TaxID=2759707 RepID=A0A7G5II62_9SPHN|nr:GNAT family acetyltransferase [Sandaracinobacteroides saxicola]QMW23054.1 GNAT family acetyltransferase [Sandaracinobacteroides saxicola]
MTNRPAPLVPADRGATIALWHDCGLTRPWNDPGSDFDRALSGPASTILGLHDAVGLAGTVMVGHDGHRGWVYYLAVAPARQRHGLGRALMTAAEAWLLRHGVPKLNLMVRADNAVAQGFYQAIGYTLSDVTVLQKGLA